MNNIFDCLNKFFDKIYVITLKKSTDRHPIIKENLNGLNYELFWGVDGSKLDLDVLKSKGDYHSGLTKLIKKLKGDSKLNDLSLGSIGCFLSHKKIYEDIIENNYKNTLILEDDILIDHSVRDSLKNALGELPNNWELLYFGYWENTLPINLTAKMKLFLLSILSSWLPKYNRNDFKRRYPKPFSKNLDISGRHFGTYGYALSFAGARKMLKYSQPITQHIDILLGDLCNYEWINSFNLKQPLVYPNQNIDSTIVSNTEFKPNYFTPDHIKTLKNAN